MPPQPILQRRLIAEIPAFLIEREIISLVHVHQLAGMAAEDDFDPQAAIERQRRQHDALVQIMAVGQMDHSPQMLLVVRSKPASSW